MKKIWLAVAMVGTLGLVGYQIADAGPGRHGGMMGSGNMMGPDCGMHQGQGACGQAFDEETIKAREKFFNDTTDLRKKIVTKRAEMAAVMNSETPDEKKAAKLSGELFDLRSEFHKKAEANNLTAGKGYFCGGPHRGGCGDMGVDSGPHHQGWGW